MNYFIFNKSNDALIAIESTSRQLSLDDPNFYEVSSEEPITFPIVFSKYSGNFQNKTIGIINSPLLDIDNHWKVNYNDYKSARVDLYMNMLIKGGFENLSLIEKKIVSKWFIVGRTERNSVHTIEEQIQNGLEYNTNSISARKKRLTKCMMEVYNRLNDDQIKAIMFVMDFSNTTYNFVEVGQEGTLEGYGEGLYDYIEARPGTKWELTGLKAQNYIPVGYNNCVELAARLMDILVNGNY